MARPILGVFSAREQVLLRQTHRQAMVIAGAIVLLTMLPAAAVWWHSPALRAAPRWPMAVDGLTVLVGVVCFEGLFYLLGHRWRYLTPAELRQEAADCYLKSGTRRSS